MSDILYEHPLNERIRNYLRLEQLFTQASNALTNDITTCYASYFNALFAALDLLERNDIRGELIKDLKKLEKSLVIWSEAPNIDNKALQQNLKQTTALLCQLTHKQPPWSQLKNDKLLDSIRKRFAMNNGCCCSDLPQLQFWLSQIEIQIIGDCQHWLGELNQIRNAIELTLMFIRQRAEFFELESPSAFYQDNGDGISLLRIKIASQYNYYPTISGNKYRFSIRFAQLCQTNGQKFLASPVNFSLARC